MQPHGGCLAPGLGRFPSQNQMSNRILVPGLNLFPSLSPGPSLDLGLPLGHAPDRGQGLAPDPNLAATTLGTVREVFCTCLVVVAQVIEVENTSMLYILNNPDGMSLIVNCSAPSLRCSLVQGRSARFLPYRKVLFKYNSSQSTKIALFCRKSLAEKELCTLVGS